MKDGDTLNVSAPASETAAHTPMMQHNVFMRR